MEDDLEFDMASAVNDLGAELGFGGGEGPEEPEAAGPASPAAQAPIAQPVQEAAGKEQTPTATPSPLSAPRTWRAEAAAEFAALSPTVQQEILKREEDIFKGIESYKAEAAFGKGIKSVLEPYLPVLEQYGIAPETQVQTMMEANYTLAFGTPQQKADLIRQVIADYNIPLELLGAASHTDPANQATPEVLDLQKRVEALQSQLTGAQRQRDEEKRSEVTKHVQAFASDPKNVYFEELANDIAHLLRTGAEKTIEGAYEKAMWINAGVREKELARRQAEKADLERKTAEEKAAAARKATAANVRPRAKSGSATAPLGSMDDTLSETLREIRGRG